MRDSIASSGRLNSDAVHFRLVYIAAFPFCLLAALLGRVGHADHGTGRSILGDAKAAARTFGSFALMG